MLAMMNDQKIGLDEQSLNDGEKPEVGMSILRNRH
jgi:hypothetical protein